MIKASQSLDHDGNTITEKKDHTGFISDDLLRFLLIETNRIKTSLPGACTSWSSTLHDFISRLVSWGEQYQPEVQFVSALLDITLNQPSAIPETNYYAPYIQFLVDHISFKQHSLHGPLLSDEQVGQYLSNTMAVYLYEPESKDEWSTSLRKARRMASLWGDDHERAFYSVQLALLSNRLASLPAENPYHETFDRLLKVLAIYQVPPLDFIVQNTIAVKTIAHDNCMDWLDYLHQAQREAARQGEENEKAFFEALIRIVQDDPVNLPLRNQYQVHLEQIQTSIAEGKLITIPLPTAILASIMHQTIEAKTNDPKTIDVLIAELEIKTDEAQKEGRFEDVTFYKALLALLHDKPTTLPAGSIYEPNLEIILTEIGKSSLRPSTETTIPQFQIENMVQMVVAAQTYAVETSLQVQAVLEDYRRLLDTRDMQWQNERSFTNALLALLNGQRSVLTPTNPYFPFLEGLVEEIRRYGEIRSKGGKIPPHELDALLRTTAVQSQQPINFVKEHIEEQLENVDNYITLMKDTHKLTKRQQEWKEILLQKRDELVADVEDWHHEIELLTTLIAVVGQQSVSLTQDSPYYTAVQTMLSEIEYTPGIPDMMNLNAAALTSSPEEFSEYFVGLFSGKNDFLKHLDVVLMNTVTTKTIMPDNLSVWIESLERNYQKLAERSKEYDIGSIQNELDIIRSLQDVLRDKIPQLPEDHPYYIHLCQVIESIHIFSGRSVSSYVLSGQQILHLSMMTAGVMTIAQDHYDTWKESLEQLHQDLLQKATEWQDALAFIDALFIVLENRPVDLPLKNPYRPYLHFTQLQMKQMQ
jgi:hypothetical protein